MSQKFCAQFWQFDILTKMEQTSWKYEYRNTKSETISKSECSKFKTNAAKHLHFKVFWEFEFMSFEFVLRLCSGWWAGRTIYNFDIRISDFPVSDRWIKYNHFYDISFCQFGIQNLWDGALGHLILHKGAIKCKED